MSWGGKRRQLIEEAAFTAGLKSRMTLMTTVFAGAVIIATGCFGYLMITANDTSVSVGRIDERLKAVESSLGEIKSSLGSLQDSANATQADLGKIKHALEIASVEPAPGNGNMVTAAPCEDAFKGWSGVLVKDSGRLFDTWSDAMVFPISNVLLFRPREVRETEMWCCNCGCVTFYLYDDGNVQCAACKSYSNEQACYYREDGVA